MTGIRSFGFYVPQHRIKISDIATAWGKNPTDIEKGLGLIEKTVASRDEDSLTMAWQSASSALQNGLVDISDIRSVLFGSETPVYAVNPTSSILAGMLGIDENYTAHDIEFACKAGTAGLISSLAFVQSGMGKTALVTAADKATGKPGDALEYSAAAGSVSFVVDTENVIAEVVASTSFTSDTPDFWRRSGEHYPTHAGRFTGQPAYFRHVAGATEKILAQTQHKPTDFDHVIFHMPNGKFPVQIAQSLGFDVATQLTHSLVSPILGNSYSACALMGLAAVLDVAKPGELILLTSYGSGAGSDSFIFRVTDAILNHPQHQFKTMVEDKHYIDYITYRTYMKTF